jgi:hypothetical protein
MKRKYSSEGQNGMEYKFTGGKAVVSVIRSPRSRSYNGKVTMKGGERRKSRLMRMYSPWFWLWK